LSVYIHIPYCKQVCYYCDFHFRVAMKDKPAMLDAVKKEIELRKDYLRSFVALPGKIPVESIYFGGGTPSVLDIGEIGDLLHAALRHYRPVAGAEITLEANPDDLNEAYLQALTALGFNRLSVGIQSFFDDDLVWMNRRHDAREAVKSIEAARREGFGNISIDLIYGLPGMTVSRWKENLLRALDMDVPHISAYHLAIEPRTVFGRRQGRGEVFAVPEEDSAEQFDLMLDMLQNAGYEHYEISNFAREGFRSRHNCAYWQQKPYIGFGPSAHSYDGGSRQWNISSNNGYIEAVNAGGEQWFEKETLSQAEKYNDYILTSLRTVWGADLPYIRQYFGTAFEENFLRQAKSYISAGFLRQENEVFVLTHKGKLIADRIASDLFFD
jgi:oxygen-independent coproporphyrinogen-3 oxidase